jgi:hypothetical protein
MKKIGIFFCLLALGRAATGQSGKFDSVAIRIIDHMANVIGDMNSCSFRLNTAVDMPETSNELVKYFTDYDVYLQGSDKMLINVHGHKGHRNLIYNGVQLAYYSFDENNYALLPAAATTLKTIDSIHAQYGIEFPAADFFYPEFTEDLLENSDSLRFLGIVEIDNKEYFQIIAYGKENNFQFWITNDAFMLPAKFSITYNLQEGHPQYLANFSQWMVNPELPPSMFEFLPPPGAAKLRMMSKDDK